MFQAKLRHLVSPDADPLEDFRPNREFGILVQAIVGPADGPGEESFDFLLCTPEWFADNKLTQLSSVVSGRHILFVREFDFGALYRFIANYCDGCVGDTWKEVAEKVGRIGHWEFEDYRA